MSERAEGAPRREVVQGDGVAWLRRAELDAGHAVITSLPDRSGLPGADLEGWRAWFVETAALICGRLADEAVAIFYQTDVRRDGRWIDKAYLVARGAEAAGARCLWHKLACRVAPGHATYGRPGYGHWLAFSRGLRLEISASTPDVLPELGEMTWSRAMPMTVAVGSCRFLLDQTACRTVVGPFCGHGTILAVANAHGLDALGVELHKKRVKRSRNLQIELP